MKLARIYKNTFKAQGYDIIPEFLSTEEADILYKYYTEELSEDRWKIALFPDEDGLPDYQIGQWRKTDKEYPAKLARATEEFHRNEFSYHYPRTDLIHPILTTRFSDIKFTKWLEDISGHTNLKLGTNFINCLSGGDWNGPHHDGVNGKIAFIYHLTRDWKPWYGGIFFKMSKEDWTSIQTVTMPVFNQLVIMDVWGNKGMPHFVSHVVQGVTAKRLSFIGWYGAPINKGE